MKRPALRGLYAITDAQLTPGAQLLERVSAAVHGGARWIQYRHKDEHAPHRLAEARALAQRCHALGAALIINDDVALAVASGADGVHLGRDDLDLETARARLGPQAVIGVSCYDRLELAEQAADRGADYVAFGSVFPSPTKPHAVHASLELLREACTRLELPVCAIGGINTHNAAEVAATGVDLLAVISAVFGAGDPKAAAREIVRAFDSALG